MEPLSPMDEYLLAEARQDTKAMARAFLKTCPNSWCSGFNINAKGVLLRLMGGKRATEVQPVAMMRFRWQAAQDADSLVARFRLPIPADQCCIMWDQWHSQERDGHVPNFGENYDSAFFFILRGPMSPVPIEDVEGFHCPRFAQYVATAVALASLSSERQEALLKSMQEFLLKERERRAKPPIVQIAGTKRSIGELGPEYLD